MGLSALLLLGAQLACRPSASDSARASEAGWALRAASPSQTFLLGPGDTYSWELTAASTGSPCEGCSIEQDASLELAARLEPLGGSGEVALELGRASRILDLDEARDVLVRVDLFEACAAPPSCAEAVPVVLRSSVALQGSWTASAQATSTHDARGWEPEAALRIDLR